MPAFDIIRERTGFFTGHRPDGYGGYDESLPAIVWAKEQAEKALVRAMGKGFHTWICGLAQGWDMWCGEIVIGLREGTFPEARLVCARPFPSQASKWPKPARDRHRAIMDAADMVVDVNPDPYQVWKMQSRNQWMVDRASVGIAGLGNVTKGGTLNCVNYCDKLGLPWLRINHDDRTVSWNMPDTAKKTTGQGTLPGTGI